MIERVKQFIQYQNLIPKNVSRLFVAVSGGIDSCVLLDILNKLKSDLKIDIAILHFNHQVRGRFSLEDEYFVKNLAKSYNLPITVGRIGKMREKISETFLRQQRLDYFSKILEKNPGAIIATGHNLNDNVETFIMRLARGSRTRGLLGIRPSRDRFIRPLLAESRRNIQIYAQQKGLSFRNDYTNEDITILRNKIRHKIIPYLETHLDADFSNSINRVMDDLYGYYQLFEEKLVQVIAASTKRTKNGITINRKRFVKLNRMLKRELLEYCISQVYPLNYKVSDRNLRIWDDFIANAQPGKRITFLENGSALAERNFILIGDLPKERKETFRLTFGNPVTIDGRVRISISKVSRKDVKFTNDEKIEFIDGDSAGSELTVRFWRKGDFFRPLGMSNRRKLSDFFTDLKLSTKIKKETPLICRGKDIIWIAGYRLDDRFKVSEMTKKVYKLQIHDVSQ
jgi:tRNA(Ile)-lysidine synthase